MFEHHRAAVENLTDHFIKDSEFLALILVGSVARGEATANSNIGLLLIGTDAEFARRIAAGNHLIDTDELISPAWGGAQVIDLAYMTDALDRANEPTRFQFRKARVLFSRIPELEQPELEQMIMQIATYPEHERMEKMKSFYAQLPGHLPFMYLAEYSRNAYLLAETAVALVLFGGRLILAYNRMLYPGRKWFMREFAAAPDKPENIMLLAEQLLREPGIKNAEAFNEAIGNFINQRGLRPELEEGSVLRLYQDSIWNWRTSVIPPAER